MTILILEDNAGRNAYFRATFPEAVIVETAAEMIERLRAKAWSVVSLDHDLNGEAFVDSSRSDCGMEVVRWIVANKPKISQIVVHTANRKASKLMGDALDEAGYVVTCSPFGGEFDPRG